MTTAQIVDPFVSTVYTGDPAQVENPAQKSATLVKSKITETDLNSPDVVPLSLSSHRPLC